MGWNFIWRSILFAPKISYLLNNVTSRKWRGVIYITHFRLQSLCDMDNGAFKNLWICMSCSVCSTKNQFISQFIKTMAKLCLFFWFIRQFGTTESTHWEQKWQAEKMNWSFCGNLTYLWNCQIFRIKMPLQKEILNHCVSVR